MTITTLVAILLIILIIGALPGWGWSVGTGYGPSGALTVLLVVLLVLIAMGRF